MRTFVLDRAGVMRGLVALLTGKGIPMGKKPVVMIVGLIWAGMVLVGCENCKNCRNKFNATPAFPAKTKQDETTSVPQESTPPVKSALMPPVGDARKTESMPKATDSVGTKGFGNDTPSIGTPVSGNALPTSPITRDALRPSEGPPSMGTLPGQGSDYRSGESPTSRLGSTDDSRMHLPPPPVRTVGGEGLRDLPPLSNTPILPPVPLQPAPPSAPAPMDGNRLPGIDPLSK